MRCLSIQAAVLKSFPQTVIFQDVQHSCHLRENQHSGTFLLESHKQLVQNTQFTAVVNKMLIGSVRGACEKINKKSEIYESWFLNQLDRRLVPSARIYLD